MSQGATEHLVGEAVLGLLGPDEDLARSLASWIAAAAIPSDLEVYGASGLAEAARMAASHLSAPRRSGSGPSIRLADLTVRRDGTRRELTVLQVVNDDMPFLLDSTLAELDHVGRTVRFVVHPVFAADREDEGLPRAFAAPSGTDRAQERRESLIHIHLDRIDSAEEREALVAALEAVYRDARRAVADWPAMLGRLRGAVETYRRSPPPLPKADVDEAVVLLEWLEEGNFTLLGMREYRIGDAEAPMELVEGSALGILTDPALNVLRRGTELVMMTPEIRAFLNAPVPLIVTKASVRSRVHRRVHLDYVGVKLFDGDRLAGELVLVGLFTATAYTRSVVQVPFLRRKIARVLEKAEFDPAGHSGRALMNVLENYPRDEILQLDDDTLLRFAREILAVYERPRVKTLARLDPYERFVSILVFIPKDRYDSAVRQSVGRLLAGLYGGRLSASYPAHPEGPLARTHYIIGHDSGAIVGPSPAELDEAVAAAVRTWSDSLREALDRSVGGPRGRALALRYEAAFSGGYQEAFSAERAIADIRMIESLSPERTRAVRFMRRDGDEGRIDLAIFSRGEPLPLSRRVPLLESMGLRVLNERTYRIVPAGASSAEGIRHHDMLLERAAGGRFDMEEAAVRLQDTLEALLDGHAAADGFNALTLEAGLDWRLVDLLRALSRYLIQIRVPFSHDYMAATLVRYPAIAGMIVDLFRIRFDPEAEGNREASRLRTAQDIRSALDGVAGLDDDRILRHFLNLVEAAERTNFFRVGARQRASEVLAIKFASRVVDGMPVPKPLHEIFVFGRKVEGVHLRFGPVARGGLRWSDRKEDYRTEVLGLVKAQQVKNAVIVPAGAKGGFYPKELPSPSDRQAHAAEGVAAYRAFVGALLDLTDDLADGRTVPPAGVIRHDGDDPYLVVAADKGTATFSDIANGLALERGFWLGDAFASGGSNGYDHKAMGITARGAWEAVKRHFGEADVDVQTMPVTVVGIGDMSGDVFGNGMLLSKAIRLVAAFDHRDVFLDPDPADPAASWAERRRLFDLERSSWADYDRSLISSGGGVWSRTLKTIPLSPQIRALLDLELEEATPNAVISAILRARADLLFFGGIGTYVRASDETDAQVGDRTNDGIRIAASDLRVRVIGEGANLGMTQRGRIEAAELGVRLNTDAIDNSAGVNTSDLEVNVKIALARPEREGRLDAVARRALLAEMTDEVADLVLANNRRQTLALSLAERRGADIMPDLVRSMRVLEAAGRLDRAVENLPDDARLAEREQAGETFTRPELAVLLAYEKMALKDALNAGALPDDPFFAGELRGYFPATLVERFPEAVTDHRLRRHIVATSLANLVVDRGGLGFVSAVEGMTGARPDAVAAAFASAWSLFGMERRVAAVDADPGRSGAERLALHERLSRFVCDRATRLLRETTAKASPLEAVVDRFRMTVFALFRGPVDSEPAAGLDVLVHALDAALVAEETGLAAEAAYARFSEVGRESGLARIVEAGRGLRPSDRFERLAVHQAVTRLEAVWRRLAAVPAENSDGDLPRRAAELVEVAASGALTQARLTVLAALLEERLG
jgi:glutamate dehydrogenase